MPHLLSKILPLAGLAVLLTATAAAAAPAIALANASVRSGPGLGYGVVDTLRLGERVAVISCTAHWCVVHHIGPDGYVARSLLVNPYYSTIRGYYQFPPKNPHEVGRGPLVGR